ncbi:hypothetical protein TrVE_jg9010 [Triparma verrucosa]|uniref:Uncharacterized protein n=1 Tax=Triparma verrucosa TaxID=1606542 RepID=A0A9W7FMR1_9STRA|nr:hypothetical protein TrVE_jg9010 [Triparma verrucosa]
MKTETREEQRKKRNMNELEEGVEMKSAGGRFDNPMTVDARDGSDTPISKEKKEGKKKKKKKKKGEVIQVEAKEMNDEDLLIMLRRPPKESRETCSRQAFRKFFNGFPRARLERLLREANAGKDSISIEEKVAKRMELLDGVLT